MDQGILSGMVIIALMAIFVGIVAWAWSGKRTRSFNEAARLPLEEDGGKVPHRDAISKGGDRA